MVRNVSFTTSWFRSKQAIYACVWFIITGTTIANADPDACDSKQISARICSNGVHSFSYFDSALKDAFQPDTPPESSTTYKNYTIDIYYGAGKYKSSLEVLHQGEFIYGRQLETARSLKCLADEQVALGQDITGDGNPNMVIWEWGGGAHGPYFFQIYELEPQFKFIQCIEAGVGDFENLDADPAMELKVYDTTFSYWRSSYAGSPYIPVCLKYREGAYRLALNIMRKPPLPPKKLSELADQIRVLPEWENPTDYTGPPPMKLWYEVIDLVYSGNLAQARILFHLSWPYYIEGRNAAWSDFLGTLSQSDYWEGIQEINGMN